MEGAQVLLPGTICSPRSPAWRSAGMGPHPMGFPVCLSLCLILLSSCSPQCLAFWEAEGRPARQLLQAFPEDPGNVSVPGPESPFSSPAQAAGSAASRNLYEGATAEPAGEPLNTATTIKATMPTSLDAQSPSGHQGLDVDATASTPEVVGSEQQLDPSVPSKELGSNGQSKVLLAPVVTAPDPNARGDGLSTTAGVLVEGGRAGDGLASMADVFAPGVLEGGRSATWRPATEEAPISETIASSRSVTPSPPVGQYVDSDQGPDRDDPSVLSGTEGPVLAPTDAASGLQKGISTDRELLEGVPGAAATVTPQSDDWDDTKFGPASRVGALGPMAELYPTVGGEEEEDDVKKALPPRLSAAAAKGSENVQTGLGLASAASGEPTSPSASMDPAHIADPSAKPAAPSGSAVENGDPVATSRSRSVAETTATTDATKSDVFQTPRDSSRGVTPGAATSFHEAGAVLLPAATQGDFSTQEAAGPERGMEGETPTVFGISQLPEDSVSAASPLGTSLPVLKTPDAKGPVTALSGEEEEDVSVASSPATLGDRRAQDEGILGATEAMTVPPTLASLTKRTTVPATHRITTAATYELDRLESEAIPPDHYTPVLQSSLLCFGGKDHSECWLWKVRMPDQDRTVGLTFCTQKVHIVRPWCLQPNGSGSG
ncbi:armadillo-like helical domain-containing protein 4 isoform X3 [Podarcis muralis]